MYHKLSAEFYDLDPTYPPEKEVAFFSSFIEQGIPGPWLEAMSGSGRILIPLLQRGYAVEGVDNSEHMLARCVARMKHLNLITLVYDQSILELALPKKYSGIIICFASFQLIEDRAQAIATLHRLKEHLLPGGMLLIDLFVPWSSLKRAIVGGTLLQYVHIDDAPVQKVRDAHGATIARKATIDVYPYEQYVLVHNAYTKYDAQGEVVATEQEVMKFYWYYRYEMALLLQEVGFSIVNIIDQNEEMVTYQALIS